MSCPILAAVQQRRAAIRCRPTWQGRLPASPFPRRRRCSRPTAARPAGAPVDLLIENASTNGERPLWQHVEVALDTEFTSKVHTNEAALRPERPDHLSRARRADRRPHLLLAGARDRRREHRAVLERRDVQGHHPGDHRAARADVAGRRCDDGESQPALVVRNTAVTGPAAAVMYFFQMATDPGFTSVVSIARRRARESDVQRPAAGAAARRAFFWRAYGSDGSITACGDSIAGVPDAGAAADADAHTDADAVPVAQPDTAAGAPTRARRADISAEEALQHHAPCTTSSATTSARARRGIPHRLLLGRDCGGALRPLALQPARRRSRLVREGRRRRPSAVRRRAWCAAHRDSWDMIGGAGANGYSFHLDYIGSCRASRTSIRRRTARCRAERLFG